MAIYCGVDIIEIDRIKKSVDANGFAFRDRVYTETEIKYCESKKAACFQSYAVRFAAKEAVVKALGTGISRGIALKDIEITNDVNGKPSVNLYGKAREVFEELKGDSLSISLSHCESYAVAYVVISTR